MPVLNNFFDVWLSMVIIVVIYLEMTSFVFVSRCYCFMLKKKYPFYLKYKKNMINSNDLKTEMSECSVFVYLHVPTAYCILS